ncbi:Protein disulfide-isomerase 5-4 [Camellia lanceoleosa]|uniref:Protein disulfide-isomerase 5-4 n=1 Tax=Camellia lanceoleosa TaxID=1840588 RepID=A0ACC0H044_9ERIC|nr:Protein disulfide-isomerase 5-4 [Camellia lanceoleosa]
MGIKTIFKPKQNPEQLLRDWQRRLQQEYRRIESLTRGISIVSLSADATKEVANELGFFKSAGASAKDAVADLLGILLALLVLSHQITLSADQTRSIGSNSRGRDSLIDGLGSSLCDRAFWSDQIHNGHHQWIKIYTSSYQPTMTVDCESYSLPGVLPPELVKLDLQHIIPGLSCEFASVDVSDILGTNRLNITKSIRKYPIDSNLKPTGSEFHSGPILGEIKHDDEGDEEYVEVEIKHLFSGTQFWLSISMLLGAIGVIAWAVQGLEGLWFDLDPPTDLNVSGSAFLQSTSTKLLIDIDHVYPSIFRWAVVHIVGQLSKSIEVTKLVNELMKVPEISSKMKEFRKQMKKSLSGPYLECEHPDKVEELLTEIHEGSCCAHSGGRSLAHRAITQGYYWPTMRADAESYEESMVEVEDEMENLEEIEKQLARLAL